MSKSLNDQFLSELAVELRDLVTPDESILIRQELELHIEERRQHLLDMGLSEAEAEAAAIAAMGRTVDIAKPYTSIHSSGRRLSVIAICLGLVGAGFYTLSNYSLEFTLITKYVSAVFGLAAVITAAHGDQKGYALTFGRLTNFTGWVTVLGLVSLLTQYFPIEAKVAPVISVPHEVKGSTLYRSPDTGRVLSLAQGPTKDTAYLVITTEKADSSVPLLPAYLKKQYEAESAAANQTFAGEAHREIAQHVKGALRSAVILGAATGVLCFGSFCLSRLLRTKKRPKQLPTKTA